MYTVLIMIDLHMLRLVIMVTDLSFKPFLLGLEWPIVNWNWDALVAVSTTVAALTAVIGAIYAALQYRQNKEEAIKRDQPYIILDMNIVHNVFVELAIHNLGNSPAFNTHIEFAPNIPYLGDKDKTINDLNLLNKASLLPPNKKVQFFFGSMIGEKSQIMQGFDVNISFNDMYGRCYNYSQAIDPRELQGLSIIGQKGIHEIAIASQEINKKLKGISELLKAQTERSKTGFIIRGSNLSTLNEDELTNILVNLRQSALVDNGGSEDFWLNPYIYDTLIVVHELRLKILSKNNLDQNDSRKLGILNRIEHFQFRSGTGDSFGSLFDELDEVSAVRNKADSKV